MIDIPLIVVSFFCIAMVIGAVFAVFAVISNNRNNVETLEKANRRLIEMREEYDTFHAKKD